METSGWHGDGMFGCQGFPAWDDAADDFERTRIVKAIQGAWINLDRQGESYAVDGQCVTRTDGYGCRHFSLQWDPRRQQLQWGTQGRLYLTWLGDGLIAWEPNRCYSRAWRWQRVAAHVSHFPEPPPWATYGAAPYHVPPRVDVGAYHPWRRPYVGSVAWVPPYARGPSRKGGSRGAYRSCRHYGSHRHARLGCGLTNSEVSDLLFREITPEDYETLLRLDETVSKPTASASSIEGLTKVSGKTLAGETCSVCLAAFEDDDIAATLPCSHHFHNDCITKWLSECRSACPLCAVDISKSGTTASSSHSFDREGRGDAEVAWNPTAIVIASEDPRVASMSPWDL